MSAVLANDELLITRTFDAPIGLMFSLWSDINHFQKWMGPEGFDCPEMEMDFRVGGKYRGMIRSKEHGDSWFGGEYREMRPGEKLAYTDKFEDPNLVGSMLTTVTFKRVSVGTELSVVQEGIPSLIPEEMCYLGWQESLAQLAKLVEPEIAD